jgi:hypothetical protein
MRRACSGAEQHGLASIIDVEPLHVGTYIEAVTRSHSVPTAKQKTTLH